MRQLHERLGQVGEEAQALQRVDRQAGSRAAQQVRGGRHVAARHGPAAGRSQLLGRAGADQPRMVVDRAQLGQVAIRLLEVVAEDLLVLLRAALAAVQLLRPLGEPLVKRGPGALEQAVVGGVPDEDVLEPEAQILRAGDVAGPHQLLAGHGCQVIRHLRAHRLRRQLGHRRLRERQADDRGRLDDRPLLATQQVEARRQQGLDRRRHVDVGQVAGWLPAIVGEVQRSLVDHHREQLLDEQRVALRGAHDPLLDLAGNAGVAEQAADHPPRVGIGQWLEHDALRVGVDRPLGVMLEQVVPRRAEQQDRCVRHRVGQVPDQLEERLLGPMDVVDDDDDRSLAPPGSPGSGGPPRTSRPPGTARSTGRWPMPGVR